MKIFSSFLAVTFCMIFCGASMHNTADEWISLFDGKSLKDWKVGANVKL